MMVRKPLGRPLGDTEYLLEQWGWWRMNGGGIPRYISPAYVIMRDNIEQQCGYSYCITDDHALLVDGAVARLSARDAQMGAFIWLYFAEKWPALKIGKRNGVGEAKARELIKAGVAWIDCAIEPMREAS